MEKAPAFGTSETVTDAQITSAVAFVEGGVQDACDDACSICLEDFSENDPASVTVCKHEYHLQCILEWSQRSEECPMCLRPLCLKDEDSQLLVASSEQERTLRHQRSPYYQRPTVDTEFHRFPPTFSEDSDLEDRILHNLAAAGIGRAQQFTRRGGESLRIERAPGHAQCMMAPLHPNACPSHFSSAGNVFLQSSPSNGGVGTSGVGTAQVVPLESTSGSSMSERSGGRRAKESGSMDYEDTQQGTSSSAELSLSESFKSRLAVASTRYRESLTRTTRGFKEKMRVRNGTMAELGIRAREVTAGVVRAIERMSLESPDKHRESSNAPISSRDVDLQKGQSEPSRLPEWMDRRKVSSNSFGESESLSGGSTSSSSSGFGSSSRLASRLSASGKVNDDGSSCTRDQQQHSVAPLAG